MNQVERFALKYVFSKFHIGVFKTALREMSDRAEKNQGNTFIFVMNTAMWYDAQDVLEKYIQSFGTNGAFAYSRATNGYVDLGATYNSFTYGGNTIILKADKSLDVEFPTKKVAMCIDLTPDGKSGSEALKMFTFKNCQYVRNWLVGPGGRDGKSGGEVATPVAGNKEIAWGYSGVAVMNPYRSVIMMSE